MGATRIPGIVFRERQPLRVEDLNARQAHDDRAHSTHLAEHHGWGVVSGFRLLFVEGDDVPPDAHVKLGEDALEVGAGTAVDTGGRQVRLSTPRYVGARRLQEAVARMRGAFDHRLRIVLAVRHAIRDLPDPSAICGPTQIGHRTRDEPQLVLVATLACDPCELPDGVMVEPLSSGGGLRVSDPSARGLIPLGDVSIVTSHVTKVSRGETEDVLEVDSVAAIDAEGRTIGLHQHPIGGRAMFEAAERIKRKLGRHVRLFLAARAGEPAPVLAALGSTTRSLAFERVVEAAASKVSSSRSVRKRPRRPVPTRDRVVPLVEVCVRRELGEQPPSPDPGDQPDQQPPEKPGKPGKPGKPIKTLLAPARPRASKVLRFITEDDLPREVRPGELPPGAIPIEELPPGTTPIEGRPGDGTPIEERPGEVVPIEERPGEVVPIEELPGGAVPIEGRPDVRDPIEGRPGEGVPIEGRPGETHPIEERPREDVPIEERPIEERPGEGVPIGERPDGTVPIEERPGGGIPIGERPGGGVPIEERPGGGAPIEERPVEVPPIEQPPSVERPGGGAPIEERPGEVPPIEQPPSVERPPGGGFPPEEPPVEQPPSAPPPEEPPVGQPPKEPPSTPPEEPPSVPPREPPSVPPVEPPPWVYRVRVSECTTRGVLVDEDFRCYARLRAERIESPSGLATVRLGTAHGEFGRRLSIVTRDVGGAERTRLTVDDNAVVAHAATWIDAGLSALSTDWGPVETPPDAEPAARPWGVYRQRRSVGGRRSDQLRIELESPGEDDGASMHKLTIQSPVGTPRMEVRTDSDVHMFGGDADGKVLFVDGSIKDAPVGPDPTDPRFAWAAASRLTEARVRIEFVEKPEAITDGGGTVVKYKLRLLNSGSETLRNLVVRQSITRPLLADDDEHKTGFFDQLVAGKDLLPSQPFEVNGSVSIPSGENPRRWVVGILAHGLGPLANVAYSVAVEEIL